MAGLTRWGRAFAGLCACAAIGGCGSGNPETVPVHGRITLDGGAWPKPGMIIFTCTEPAAGFPKRPGKGFFDKEGEFVLTTFAEGDGLMPGTYRAMVICGEDIKDMEDTGKSYVPAKYQSPARSGIELTVTPDSDPIEFVYDIPSK
ncbi:MAG: hypothetical protein JW809_12390 [Pirellulales bacterium]|nr:hypothetical protein [Pirellulales bacterium]